MLETKGVTGAAGNQMGATREGRRWGRVAALVTNPYFINREKAGPSAGIGLAGLNGMKTVQAGTWYLQHSPFSWSLKKLWLIFK